MAKHLSLQGKVAKMKEKAGEALEGVVKTLEIQGSAFIFGAVQGAWYEPDPSKPDQKPGAHWFGVPVEALFGVGFVGIGLAGLGGEKMSDHAINIGNGALAAYVSNLGRGWGYKFAKERKAKATTSGDGSLRDEVKSLLE